MLIYCLKTEEINHEECRKHPATRNVLWYQNSWSIHEVVGSLKTGHRVRVNIGQFFKGKTKLTNCKGARKYVRLGILGGISIFAFCYGLFNHDLLIRHGIHPHPGPHDNVERSRSNLSIITYNCRGLRNLGKLRRILAKLGCLVNKGAIIALQETHAVEEKHLITYWKHKYIMNCKSNDQKGVILLFNKDFNVITQYCDDNDRTIIAKIVNENTSIIISNLYCPNNHRESIDMLEKVYEKILELFYESPESYIIIAGDMNFCMSDNDSTNRNQSKQEAEVVRNVLNNNKMLKLTDAYRLIEREKGFTWSRGTCFSR